MGGCGATEEELDCLPDITCTCNDLWDETWACPQDRRLSMTEEMLVTCPDTVSTKRGTTCTPTPPPPTTSAAAAASVTDGDGERVENSNDSTLQTQGSDSAGNGGIDLLTTMNGGADDNSAVTAVDGTTASASKDTVDTDNGIDAVEVTTPAVVVDNGSSTTITVKDGSESDSAMSSLSSSSSSLHQSFGVGGKVAMVATATATATAVGITLFL